MFTGLPLTLLVQGISRTTTPLLAERRRNYPQAVHDVVCAASAVGLIGFGAVAGLGPAGLGLLLGPGWSTAAQLVPVLAAGAGCALVVALGDSVDQARGDRRALVRSQLYCGAAMALTLGAAALYGSLPLVAAATLTAPLCAHAAQLLRWHRQGVTPPVAPPSCEPMPCTPPAGGRPVPRLPLGPCGSTAAPLAPLG